MSLKASLTPYKNHTTSYVMKNISLLFFLLFFLSFSNSLAQQVPNPGIHLVTYDSLGFRVDFSEQGEKNRNILRRVKELGIKTLILNFRGHMIKEDSSEINSTVPWHYQEGEKRLLLEYIEYSKKMGFEVALRPILLVVGPNGEFPWVDRKGRYWWHGNIDPKDVDLWFENYFKFHERYLHIAAEVGVSWYSIGAEMNSMTSGLGARSSGRELGYPQKWVELIARARQILGNQVNITYGINYTDQYVVANNQKIWGGEIEQWRFYITESFKNNELIEHKKQMTALWKSLDIIGIDYYRALGGAKEKYGNDLNQLTKQLLSRTQSHASQLDTVLTEIMMETGEEKPLYFQEVGYRSAEKSFLSPASYESKGGKVSLIHQAAAWNTFLLAYWEPKWPWFVGMGIWQVLVDEGLKGTNNSGFTPLEKPETEEIFKKYFNKQ